MKLVPALLLFLWTVAAPAVSPELRYFRYQRPLVQISATANQTCVALDPAIFTHAAPLLADLRLYRGAAETPYVIQLAEPLRESDQQAVLLNIGRHGDQTVFDAAMPEGSYGDVQLSISAHDFLATVTVNGSQSQSGSPETYIGSYTIFDLTGQKLGRSTVLHLPKSDFRFLHFRVDGPIHPSSVNGVTVSHAVSSEPKYLTAASTSLTTNMGRSSQMQLTGPANTPIDRIVFVPGLHPANFSRDVRIRVAPAAASNTSSPDAPAPVETSGNILRVHRAENGHAINEERLALDAPRIGMDGGTHWTITIENGDDLPISVSSVRLEMIERDLCFDAMPGAAYTLYYGDAALSAPRYDYAALFKPQSDAAQATAGRETANPKYEPRPDARPFTERHPILLWVALGFVMLLLGAIGLRTAKSGAVNVRS